MFTALAVLVALLVGVKLGHPIPQHFHVGDKVWYIMDNEPDFFSRTFRRLGKAEPGWIVDATNNNYLVNRGSEVWSVPFKTARYKLALRTEVADAAGTD
jgi:hypothetical protein